MLRVPFTLVAITVPIDPSTAAMIASATRASIRVKPAASEQLLRDNLDASGQPVDAYLVGNPGPRHRDGAAAGHSRWKEVDRSADAFVRAARSKIRVQRNIGGKPDQTAGGAGADRAVAGID